MSENYLQYSRDHEDHDHHDHHDHHDNEMHHLPHEMLIKTIQDCEAECEHMMHHIMMRPDFEMRKRQIALLHDCADICTLTVKYIARGSLFSKHMANLCGYICENCGRECAKFHDTESQHCADTCMKCAEECRAFASARV